MLNATQQGSGPAIVLLHPVGLEASFWQEVAVRMSSNRTVISVDLRGHGKSPRVSPSMSLLDYAADVAEFVGSLEVAPVTVVGLSFGGMIAQTMAIEFPKLVSALVVAGCPCDLNETQREILRERGAKAKREGMEAIVEETIARWFTSDFIARGGAEATRQCLLADDPSSWASAWSAISGLKTRDHLPGILVPTLCIAGSRDAACPVEAVREIATQIPGARLAILPEASHMMQIETPDLFVNEVRTFLDSLRPERSRQTQAKSGEQ